MKEKEFHQRKYGMQGQPLWVKNPKTNDLRYRKTEQVIRITFLEMIQDKDFEDISVLELTKRAQINRKTFYLHYPSLKALLYTVRTEQSLTSVKKMKAFSIPSELAPMIRTLLEYWDSLSEQDKRIWGCTNASIGENFGELMLQEGFRFDAGYDQMDEITKSFISSYLLSVISTEHQCWKNRYPMVSLENIVQIICTLLQRGLDGFSPHQAVQTMH